MEKERGQLALLLVGPMLLGMNFLVFSAYIATPAISIFLFLSLRYGNRGIFWATLLVTSFATFAVCNADKPLFEGVWYASLLLSLLITALAFEEGIDRLNQEGEKRFDLEEQIEALEEKVGQARDETTKVKQELADAYRDIEELRNLENAIGIEADKVAEQNRSLVAESLDHHRKIIYLEQTVQGFTEELGKLRELEQVSKKRVDELNALRTEIFELKQLKKPEPQKDDIQVDGLEKQKAEIKQTYDTLLAEYNTLKKSLEKLVKENRSTEEEALYQRQRKAFEQKKTMLNQTRLELIQVERELFITKKSLQAS